MRKAFDLICLVMGLVTAGIFIFDWATGVPANWSVWTFAVLGCLSWSRDCFRNLRGTSLRVRD